MSEKLEPCPFCGGEANTDTDGEVFWAACAGSGTLGPILKIEDEEAHEALRRLAGERWNRRVEPAR